MDAFDQAFAFVLGAEGGYTGNQADPGNWTGGRCGSGECRGANWGISAAAYPQLDIRALTEAQAKEIYRRDYWDRAGCGGPAGLADVRRPRADRGGRLSGAAHHRIRGELISPGNEDHVVNEISKSSSSNVAADLSSFRSLLAEEANTAVNEPCHGFTGGVSANNGHVVPQPSVHAIYWDPYFQTNADAVAQMDHFFGELVSGAYMLGLRDYGAGFGSFAGSVVLDTKAHPAPASLSDAQLGTTLLSWLKDGTVSLKPAINDTSHVYLIFAPSTTALTLGTITSGFCGYHQHAKFNPASGDDDVFWAVVQGYSKASAGKDFVNSISYCVSHELVEAFSDRDGQGYTASNGCEIGDLCEQNGTVPYGDWQMEQFWSNSAKGCVGPLFTRELGWAGIYRPSSGALWFDTRPDLASFNADVDARFKQGLSTMRTPCGTV